MVILMQFFKCILFNKRRSYSFSLPLLIAVFGLGMPAAGPLVRQLVIFQDRRAIKPLFHAISAQQEINFPSFFA
jgi:hypothetical protein